MAEILFILVTIYTVYVVHSVINKNQQKKANPIDLKPDTAKQKKPNTKEESKKTTVKHAVKKQKPTQKKLSPAKKALAIPKGSLRNPETGDIDKIATSYRMLKRWMKEALVKEKLLDKIYKTNELDDANKEKIKNALDKLKKMAKYQ